MLYFKRFYMDGYSDIILGAMIRNQQVVSSTLTVGSEMSLCLHHLRAFCFPARFAAVTIL